MAEELAPLDDDAGKPSNNNNNPIRRIFASDFHNGAFLNPKCPLCRSPYRKEAEEMFDEGVATSSIKTFLDEKDEVMSVSTIGTHMKRHYKSMEQVAALMDYCDRLDEIKRARQARRDEVGLGIDVCYLELARAIGLETKGDIGREKIRTELILKIDSSIMDKVKLLNDMEKTDEATNAIKMKFAETWKECIETEKDTEKKKMLIESLRMFEQKMEDR